MIALKLHYPQNTFTKEIVFYAKWGLCQSHDKILINLASSLGTFFSTQYDKNRQKNSKTNNKSSKIAKIIKNMII